MDLKGYSHVYKCAPKLWFDTKGKTVTVELKHAPQREIDVITTEQLLLGPEARVKAGHKFIAKFVQKINGLSVDGKPVTTYDELRDNGPDDLYAWIYGTVMSEELLTKAEIKN